LISGWKSIGRANTISNFLPLVRRLLESGKLGFSKIRTKIYHYQRNLAKFIKEHRTVKLLHLLRRYSALAVVVSCAVLVAATNVASGKSSSGFLFGYLGENNGASAVSKKIDSEANRKENLAFAPLVKTKTTIDPQEKDEETVESSSIQGQAFMASANTSLKDPEEDGGVKIYTVKNGDTVSSIAVSNQITVNTILWANDIDNIDSIMPGDKIFILPVAGLSHTVQSGDTIDAIAKKYKADKDKIIAFNNLPADGSLKEGEDIIIPDGEKEVPRTVPVPETSIRRQYATPVGGTPTVSGWRKLEGKAGSGHKFPYGYCTWYVAQRRYVPWGGNAGTWIYHAKSMGYMTSKTPRVGSIMVTAESWWGHVAIVESVSGGSITVSEMNYERWGRVDRRTVATSSRVIKGYIY
jgi:surface antigen/LysM repeat protein